MSPLFFIQRLGTRTTLIASSALLCASAALIASHAVAVRGMKQTGLPSAMRIPSIEQRIAVLRQQAEVAELRASLSGGMQQELLHAYVLPSDHELERLLGTFDVLFSHLEQSGGARSISAVTVGEDVATDSAGIKALPVSFNADMTERGFDTLMLAIRVSGLFTVSDLLEPSDIKQLLRLTEQENPSSINALEEFLASDLLRYAENPGEVEDRLMLSFSSAVFEQSFRALMDASRVREAVDLLAELQGTLRANRLWPMRLLTVDHVDVESTSEGRVRVKVQLKAYMRGR